MSAAKGFEIEMCSFSFRLPISLFRSTHFVKPGVNFINVLRAAFACADPKSTKNDNLNVFFMLLGPSCVKAARRMLVKMTPGSQFHQPFGTKKTQMHQHVFFFTKNIHSVSPIKLLQFFQHRQLKVTPYFYTEMAEKLLINDRKIDPS